MTSSLAASFECQDYKELTSIEQAYPLFLASPTDWLVQLKYDGIWGKVILTNKVAKVFSKTGQLKNTLSIPEWLYDREDTVLLAEYMFGSQWSQHPDRKGLLYVFDCLVFEGKDLSTIPYESRKKIADNMVTDLGHPFTKCPSYPVDKLGPIWLHLEKEMKYEGVIIRNKTSTYFTELYKLKTEVEDDYVMIGRYEGTGKYLGMLGGFKVGQYHTDGQLRPVMDVGGGFTDLQRREYYEGMIGELPRVMSVKGKSRFSSGALRHPQFVCFRDDKLPQDCKLK